MIFKLQGIGPKAMEAIKQWYEQLLPPAEANQETEAPKIGIEAQAGKTAAEPA